MITFKKRVLYSLVFLVSNPSLQALPNINLVGFVNDKGSGACHTSSFIECLHAHAKIKVYKTQPCSIIGFPDYFRKILENSVDLTQRVPSRFRYTIINQPLKGMTIYTDLWDRPNGWKKYKALSNESTIKFAYCVTESTLVPSEWVARLNGNFDAVLVPDEWLIDVYKNSGVTLPVFVLPEALDLNSLLETPIKTTSNKPFVFGFSGGFWPRKNHELLMKAFAQEFEDNPDVILKIHGRSAEQSFEGVLNTYKELEALNIEVQRKKLPRSQYEDFITSLDCYVTISKGEGFSIVPREALAAGIPCILSDNTAQKTICRSGCVYPIPAEIVEPFHSLYAIKDNVGNDYNCDIEDVKKALRNVYENYEWYLALAIEGREWTKQYLAQNLKQKYLTLVKPKKVILSNRNEIVDDCLITNSKELFEKYKCFCDPKTTVFRTS